MPPSTRSKSANNTPAKSAAVSELDTLVTPTRKAPHCTKCNRPRAGHPRSGCPFVADDENADTNSSNIADALGSLTITGGTEPKTPTQRKGRRSLGVTTPSVPVEFEDMKKVLRERRRSEKTAALVPSQTLDSLPDSELEMLLIPGEKDGVGADDRQETNRKGEVHWKDRLEMLSTGGTITTKEIGKPRAVMPGTLITPWSSLASVPDDQKPVISSSSSSASIPSTDTIISIEVVSPSSTSTPRPLARTMSMEERAGFMNHLEELSTAKAYMVSNADLAVLKEQTPKGFIYEEEEGRSLNLSSAAGGVIVGAVATFTGLAFS
ncbi:hypothetical protein BT96DRAFT_916579 [Gymnopus androsaceus JB14]|uniref:Uncharacterized protein n=1 Tax=Gymnopus androsaceus JB14 TaxID=1447944 RepID=A0A6A4I755_9AGAR|nr:hypothetical protein BT96DRAFT_916579 [Gymnopus androsaceus JB14]